MPRARLNTPDGGTTEWKSKALKAYQRRTIAADAVIVPVHTDGWAHFRQNAQDLRATFDTLGFGKRLKLLDPGVTTAIERSTALSFVTEARAASATTALNIMLNTTSASDCWRSGAVASAGSGSAGPRPPPLW